MKNYLKIAAVLLPVVLLISCEKKKEIISGTSLELAIERKATISNLQYALLFDIPESQKDSIPASVTIRFDLKNTASFLQLDFNAGEKNIKKIVVNGNEIETTYENEHILIARKYLSDGANAVTIDFIAGDKALNRNADYLYTLFVPSRAASCFPVFDQPDLKAVYHLELVIPSPWHAITNGSLVSTDSAADKKRLSFSDTKPTSTYQFAFAAGKFQKAIDAESGMIMLYRETDSVKVARNVAKIFELHKQSLAWLTDYTGIAYPYEKFGFALMPAFQFGGMEHPGNIFYRESSLFLESTASVNDELRRASLIAHETAHMWFGNLVTMKWFNDVWLKEVFANFMASKIVNPSFPQINHPLRFLMAHYPAAYEIDRSEGSHPVQQELDNLKNAGSVYGAIIYQKAPIMMRNLESLMGEQNFKSGLREYLGTFAYRNATWDDLINVLKNHTKQDLEVWNTAWIKTKGMPSLSYTLNENKFTLKVINDSLGVVWPQFFSYQFDENGKENRVNLTIKKDSLTQLTLTGNAPVFVIPNYTGRGYGYFATDEASRNFMLRSVNSIESSEVRAGTWINIWEYVVRGEIDPQTVLKNLLVTMEKEKDPLLLEYLTDKTGRIFWQFLTPAQRQQISAELDQTLFTLMSNEKDNSIKRVLFNCFRNVALSPAGLVNMKKLWSDEITAGLVLSERDHTQLACELALREVEGHEAILKTQIEKITNPDRRMEMEFVAPSLSADPAVRDAFFETLKAKENRTHEPWVLEAQRYLNHPLRAKYSIKYVMPSLELLEEMQRTGDIFFPKGWLDATLGEYQSREAAEAVRQYVDTNKTLRYDLRNKLLQSSDMLFRAERIVSKNEHSTN